MWFGILAFVFCFSYFAEGADWFSGKNMTLEEKIKLTERIRIQTVKQKNSSAQKHKYMRSNNKKSSVHSPSRLYVSKKDRHNVRMILALPLENRKQALWNYGARGFLALKYLVFSKKEQMSVRWKALTSLARLYPEEALPISRKALRSSVWFLRNAGLIAIEIIDVKESIQRAGDLLNDPSLIVRTAAVDVLKRNKASQYKIQLMEKLNAPDSFYKNKSLWIRHHIVSALASFCEPGEERMFIAFLKDPDERLHAYAISALETLTGKTFRTTGDKRKVAEKTQKNKWISWWTEGRYNSKTHSEISIKL